jgi:pre-mRNA-splicing factor 18
LKQKAGDKDMIISTYHIMNCCLVREFIQAHDKYIELSIGTAPWPMGVAMLGITVKRNALRLSHVLND